MPEFTPLTWTIWWSLIGLVVGSFLNVAIYRYPLENESVSHPRRSRCPSCRRELTWKDNIPVLSWVFLRGRCRSCGWRIPWRYPLVELLTGAGFGLVAYLAGGRFDLTLVHAVAVAGLIVATFVDFDCFEIPDGVSIGGMILAPIFSLAVPDLHAASRVVQALSPPGEVPRVSALITSLAGLLVGGGVLLAIGWVGKRIYGREAMGFGDVKLLAAGGGLIGPGGALCALLLASFFASIVGVGNMLRYLGLILARARQRGTKKSFGRALAAARIAGRYLPFGPYLALGIGICLIAWNEVTRLLVWLVL